MKARINKEILALAIPNIVSNISVPLISTVDTSLMGRMSELHLGAIGLGAMIFNFLYWNFGFLRMGTTGMTSQAYGKDSEVEITANLFKALLVAFIIGTVMIFFRVPLYTLAEFLLNIGPEHSSLVEEYFGLRILAAPASLALFAVLGWLFGMQNAIYPLILTIVINVTNIATSFLFVMNYGWGIYGVAMGTVIAQYTGLIVGGGMILYRYRETLSSFHMRLVSRLSEYKRFFALNSDIFIRTLFLSSAFGFFYAQSSQEGEIVLAVNVVLLQFLHWMSYIIDGYAYAAEALVGKYIGKKKKEATLKTIKLSMIWGAGMAVAFALIYGVWSESLLRIFTDEIEVIQAAEPFLNWMILLPIFGFACYIWDGVFIGMTASVSMRNSMIVAFALYILSWFLTKDIAGSHSLWVALIGFLTFRGLLQTYLFKKHGLQLR